MTDPAPQKTRCCPPHVPRASIVRVAPGTVTAQNDIPRVDIPGGTAFLGTQNPVILDDAEGPLRKKRVEPFLMGQTTVTNAQFAAFVSETGYVTDAEKFGWSFVFHAQVPGSVGPTEAMPNLPWWRRVDGANWKDINGGGATLARDLPDHPVVHVSWHDARAFAAWSGARLPTEAEWEHAARAGQGDVRFPWGDAEPDDQAHFPCNIWQGRFPDTNTGADGHITTAPVTSFAANGFGLYNLVGNVWEWTAEPFVIRSQRKGARQRQAAMQGYKLAKGGSFLCHKSYCYRYRIAARTGNAPDSAATHIGFRVVWDSPVHSV
jgi:formylglycine-generating enzyme